MYIRNINISPVNTAAFSGHKKTIDNRGEIQQNFYYLYDPDKYKCELELYNISLDDNGDIDIDEEAGEPAFHCDVPTGGVKVFVPQSSLNNFKDSRKRKYELTAINSNDETNGVLDEKKQIHAYNEDGENLITSNSNLGFAYRFKLTEIGADKKPIKGKEPMYAFDNGDVIGIHNKGNNVDRFNVVLKNSAVISKNGPMQLIMPDSYYPFFAKVPTNDLKSEFTLEETDEQKKKALSSVRTHANKLGGRFDGIIKQLPKIKEEGISRIVGTPFTKDTVSSHMYWTENAYQISPSIGTEYDFRKLQQELFKNGINWIADAALVNEGLNGMHVSAAIKANHEIEEQLTGESYVKGMFRGLGKKRLGVLPERTKITPNISGGEYSEENDSAVKHTKMKIINSPFVIENSKLIPVEKSDKLAYFKDKPTYIQLYDDRLASEEQIDSMYINEMKTYDRTNVLDENGEVKIYDITTHDDAVYPFAFEVEPEMLKKNLEKALETFEIEDSKKIPYEAIETVTNFDNFQLVPKGSAGGFDFWDGNVDITKLNFFLNASDFNGDKNLTQEQIDNMKKGTLIVKDYALKSGIYWTKTANDAQIEGIVEALKQRSKYEEDEDEVLILKERTADEYYNMIQAGIGKDFPESLKCEPGSEEEKNLKSAIGNVLNGTYSLKKLSSQRPQYPMEIEKNISDEQEIELNKDDFTKIIAKEAMNTPLETLHLTPNLLSVLTSPYLVNRPNEEKYLGLSNFELSVLQKADPKYEKTLERMKRLYEKDLAPLIFNAASGVVYKTNNEQGLWDEEGLPGDLHKDGKITDFGRYVISEIAPDLTKYFIMKALEKSLGCPPAAVIDDKGQFFYNDFHPAVSYKTTEFNDGSFYDEEIPVQDINGKKVFSNGNPEIDQGEYSLQALEGKYKNEYTEIIKSKDINKDLRNAEMLLKALENGFKMLREEDRVVKKKRKYPEKEADKIRKSELEKINEKIAGRLQGRTLEDYKVADMLMDRTESGLGWRIDAAKDISCMDAVRSGKEDMEKAWDDTIKFWKLFNQSILKENPHAYTTAEITDLPLFFTKYDEDGKYRTDSEAERKFLEQTGISSTADYNYKYAMVPSLVTQYSPQLGCAADAESGWAGWMSNSEQINKLVSNLSIGWDKDGHPNNPGFLFQSPEEGITNSYSFVGNHDKPRILHGLALNMNLFSNGFEEAKDDWGNAPRLKEERRRTAYFVLNPDKVTYSGKDSLDMNEVNKTDFDKLNPKAIAMGERIDVAIDRVGNPAKYNDKIQEGLKYTIQLNDEERKQLKLAVSNLAQGKYKGENFLAEAFGTRPFEIAIKSVLNEANYLHAQEPNKYKISFDKNRQEEIQAALLQDILEPAFEKYKSIYKKLIVLPGSPTDFAGDRMGSSGFETKAKNYHQQNRNVLRWDWLEDDKYKFIQDNREDINEIAKLRKNPKLSALNDGSTVAIPVTTDNQKISENMFAMIRYNDKSTVLTLMNSEGMNVSNAEKPKEKTDDEVAKYDKIILNLDLETDYAPFTGNSGDYQFGIKEGLRFGLKEGTKFKNINDDGIEYRVVKEGDNYCLKAYEMKVLPGGHPSYEETNIKIPSKEMNTMILYKVA